MLAAMDIPSEETEKVKALIHDLASKMKMSFPKESYEPEPIHEDVEAFLAAKYRDKPLPPLSAELRAKLGACIPEISE